MTVFLRLLADSVKKDALTNVSDAIKNNRMDKRVFRIDPEVFRQLPGTAFAYWVDPSTRETFVKFPEFESNRTNLVAKRGVNSNDDFRFLRVWWEVASRSGRWVNHPKGGGYSPYYADLPLVVDWHPEGRHLEAERVTDRVYSHAIVPSRELYFRPGLTWSLRTKSRISMRVMPSGCVFGSKGPAVIEHEDDHEKLLAVLAVCSSRAFYSLLEIQLAAADAKPGGAAHSFEVGVIQRTPFPDLSEGKVKELACLARQAWKIRRSRATYDETSHAFLLPAALCRAIMDEEQLDREFASAQEQIDRLVAGAYGLPFEGDQTEPEPSAGTGDTDEEQEDEEETEALFNPSDSGDTLLSWAVGVAFGRFDWRLATGERAAPPEPEPFDPLPTRSPGMLPDDAEPFHAYGDILVDDHGHPHDLPRLVEEVLVRVDAPVPPDVRRWLQRDFFPFHLQRYSKSRRKAPIYWPLSIASGSYTLWVYYPSLTSQTLYTAVNDFIEPKLKQVGQEANALRTKGSARSREEDRTLEALQSLEQELIALRDTLLQIAPTYRPNHDDGVQITAAPLWSLFRHKPWQKLLKDTWAKLEKGEYDWAHLAMAYWPDRIREKCKTDKSLAIAHNLEHLYVEPEPAPAKTRGRKKGS